MNKMEKSTNKENINAEDNNYKKVLKYPKYANERDKVFFADGKKNKTNKSSYLKTKKYNKKIEFNKKN